MDDDVITFDVCGKTSTVEGSYLRKVEDDDTSAFVLSRIRLIDFYTLKTREFEFKGEHYGYSITAQAGKYYITGEAYSKKGKAYYIPMVEVVIGCEENKTRNMELEYIANFTPPLETLSGYGEFWRHSIEINSNSLKFDGESNTCSKPKVGVYVTIDNEYALNMLRDDMKLLYGEEGYENAPPAKIARYFSFKIVQFLKSTSPGVDIISYGEILDSLGKAESSEKSSDLSRTSLNSIPEYIYKVSISGDGDLTYYSVNTKLVEFPKYSTVNPTHFYSSLISNPLKEIKRIVRETGDLSPIIDDFEAKHPVPPRDPRLEISVVPESVSPDSKETRKATIQVKVTNCKGVPAIVSSGYGISRQEVFFQKYPKRGVAKADWEATKVSVHGVGDWEIISSKNWVIGDTRDGGIAEAQYTLKKGINAGTDRVKIITYGRGMKKASGTAIIKISGIGIEAKPEKEEISPREQTDIYISIYKENPNGTRTPLSGKPILIEKSNLLDGEISVLGATDANGNPVTDENGKAVIKYLAGKKEGLVKIPVKYRSELGEVQDIAFTKVRKDEYIITINFQDSPAWNYEYDEGKDYKHHAEASSTLNLNAKIIWDRTSQKEEIGSWDFYLRGNRHDYYHKYSYWYEWSDDSSRWEKTCDINSYVGVNLASGSTGMGYRAIVYENKRGDIVIRLDPLDHLMPLAGTDSRAVNGVCILTKDGEYAGEENPGGSLGLDYSGIEVKLKPPRSVDCVRASHPKLSMYSMSWCQLDVPRNFPEKVAVLKKTGNHTYAPFSIDTLQRDQWDEDGYGHTLKGWLYRVKSLHITAIRR